MRRIALACALLPAACAAPIPLSTPATGVVVGTIASDGRCSEYTLYVAGQDSGKTYRIDQDRKAADKLLPRLAGSTARTELIVQGAPFAVEMPAGRYELRGWQIRCGASTVRSQTPAGIGFTVDAGQSIYLGSFQFQETAHIGTVTTGASVTLREQAARDLPLIHAAFPTQSTYHVALRLAYDTVIEGVGEGIADESVSFVSVSP